METNIHHDFRWYVVHVTRHWSVFARVLARDEETAKAEASAILHYDVSTLTVELL